MNFSRQTTGMMNGLLQNANPYALMTNNVYGLGAQALGSALGRRRRRTNYVTDWNMAPQSSFDPRMQALGQTKYQGQTQGQLDMQNQVGDPMQAALGQRRMRIMSKGGY